MPIMNTGDVVELTCFGKQDSQAILNVFHYKYRSLDVVDTDAAYTDLMQELIADFRNQVWAPAVAPWRGGVAVQYRMERIRAQKVSYGARHYFVEEAVNQDGTGGGTALPSATQLTVTLRGTQVGKGLTGGKRFSGLTTGDFTAGVWNNVIQAQWNVIAQNLVKPLVISFIPPGFKFDPVIWSITRPLGNNQVRAAIVQPEVRTMKRRVVGRGI